MLERISPAAPREKSELTAAAKVLEDELARWRQVVADDVVQWCGEIQGATNLVEAWVSSNQVEIADGRVHYSVNVLALSSMVEYDPELSHQMGELVMQFSRKYAHEGLSVFAESFSKPLADQADESDETERNLSDRIWPVVPPPTRLPFDIDVLAEFSALKTPQIVPGS